MDTNELAGVELFQGLTPDQLEACAELFKADRVLMGEHLTDESDFGYSFFVVLEGQVVVKVNGSEVARLNDGDFFGETALVTGDRRNATVIAAETTRLAKLMTWDFQELMAQSPELAARIEAAAEERKRA